MVWAQKLYEKKHKKQKIDLSRFFGLKNQKKTKTIQPIFSTPVQYAWVGCFTVWGHYGMGPLRGGAITGWGHYRVWPLRSGATTGLGHYGVGPLRGGVIKKPEELAEFSQFRLFLLHLN